MASVIIILSEWTKKNEQASANKTLELTYLYLNYLRVLLRLLGQKNIDRRFTDNLRLRNSRRWKCFSLGPSFCGISFAPSPGFPLLIALFFWLYFSYLVSLGVPIHLLGRTGKRLQFSQTIKLVLRQLFLFLKIFYFIITITHNHYWISTVSGRLAARTL